MDAAPGKPELFVRIRKTADGAEVRMDGIDEPRLVSERLAGETEALLMGHLGAGVTLDAGAAVLTLPEKMPPAPAGG